ncbi:MAG TPA: hypothetical protein ENI58_07990 [Nitrospirae bacterium]|nr:hypothetical protein [Nitrospirota bacterium]
MRIPSFYIVYISKSETTSQYYIGYTDNIDRRLSQHNNPDYYGTSHTSEQLPERDARYFKHPKIAYTQILYSFPPIK